MSMPVISKSLTKVSNDYCNVFSVSNQKTETLQEYVQRVRNEKKLSTTDVERNSNKQISSSYVTRIENEPNKKVSPEKLQALAKGLDVPEHELLTVAGFKNSFSPEAEKFKQIYGFLSGYEDLAEEDKDELQPTIVMLANDIRRRLLSRRGKK